MSMLLDFLLIHCPQAGSEAEPLETQSRHFLVIDLLGYCYLAKLEWEQILFLAIQLEVSPQELRAALGDLIARGGV